MKKYIILATCMTFMGILLASSKKNQSPKLKYSSFKVQEIQSDSKIFNEQNFIKLTLCLVDNIRLNPTKLNKFEISMNQLNINSRSDKHGCLNFNFLLDEINDETYTIKVIGKEKHWGQVLLPMSITKVENEAPYVVIHTKKTKKKLAYSSNETSTLLR